MLLPLTVCYVKQGEGEGWMGGGGGCGREEGIVDSSPVLVHSESVYSTPSQVFLSAFCLRSVHWPSLQGVWTLGYKSCPINGGANNNSGGEAPVCAGPPEKNGSSRGSVE